MGPKVRAIPWTKRRHHFTRDELRLSFAQSLDGNGPDAYAVQPAERVRFAIQILRETGATRTLRASIPIGSEPGRRRLLDHGWERVTVGRTPYLQRTFRSPDDAATAIADAYVIAYGGIGDEKGWYIVTPAMVPRVRWREPWTGEAEPVPPEDATLDVLSSADGRGGSATRAGAAVVGIAAGLVCAWAAVQSFTASAGWTIGPGLGLGVVLGCVALATTIALSGIPDFFARRGRYLWGDLLGVRVAIIASFAAIPAIVWGIVLIRMFGTPPAR